MRVSSLVVCTHHRRPHPGARPPSPIYSPRPAAREGRTLETPCTGAGS